MCILILQKKRSKRIEQKYLEESARRNPDGAGFAWAENGKIKTFKSLNSDLVIRKYNYIHDNIIDNTDIMLHFRIKTHGSIGIKNIHPFFISDNVVMGHNGIIYNVDIPKSSDITDSHAFGIMIRRLNYWDNKIIHNLMEEYIGYSKICFLRGDGKSVILNEKKGQWEGSTWFSNNTWKIYEKVTTPYSSRKKSKDINRDFSKEIYSNKLVKTHFCFSCGMKLKNDNEQNSGFCKQCSIEYGIPIDDWDYCG